MTTVYIAGPMRGIPEFNFPAFIEAGRALMGAGHTVYNPAVNDLKNGFVPWGMAGTEAELQDIGFSMADALRWDLDHVLQADVIVMLPGWEHSSGACHERATAQLAGKAVWYMEDPELRAEAYDVARPNTNEVRVTNEVTGGQKGTKPERMDLVPSEAWEELGRVYGFGAQKYASHNWRKGYDWSLSIAALMRHVAAFNRGETLDPESGLHHLAHAMFHCCSLIVFGAEHPELDDRYDPWDGEHLADFLRAGEAMADRNPHDPQEWNDPDVVWDVDPDLDIDITDADLGIDWSGPLTSDGFDYDEFHRRNAAWSNETSTYLMQRAHEQVDAALDEMGLWPIPDPIDRDVFERDEAWRQALAQGYQEFHSHNVEWGDWLNQMEANKAVLQAQADDINDDYERWLAQRPVAQQKIERIFLERSDIHPPITVQEDE